MKKLVVELELRKKERELLMNVLLTRKEVIAFDFSEVKRIREEVFSSIKIETKEHEM
jgi:hypothetical protein